MDPTQANAVAGPSRLPYTATAPATPPRQPALPVVDPAAAAAGAGEVHPATAAPSGGNVRGPTIVPSLLGQDGVKTVPHLFELCEVEDLITLIASMLDRLISHNDRIPLTPTGLTRFHSRAPPSINVRDYLLRIARYTNVEPCCLLILLPYVDKVCAKMTTFTISSLTVHRFIIAGVSVGSKALSDSFCTNGRYARVGGVSIAEMNLLEKEFCEAIDWRLTTTGTVLAHYYTSLVTAHPLYRLAPDPPSPAPRPLAPEALATPALASKVPLPQISPGQEQEEEQGRRSSTASSLMSGEGDVSMDDAEGEAESDTPMEGLSAPNGHGNSNGHAQSSASLSGSPTTSASASASSSAYSPRGRGSGAVSGPSPSLLAPQPTATTATRRPSSPLLHNSALPPYFHASSTIRTSSPALIPAPPAKRLAATASNLPSPVRGVGVNGTGPVSPGGGGDQEAANPLDGLSFAQLAATADGDDVERGRGRREWVGSTSGSEGGERGEEDEEMSPRSGRSIGAAEALERDGSGRRGKGGVGVKGHGWHSPRATAGTDSKGLTGGAVVM